MNRGVLCALTLASLVAACTRLQGEDHVQSLLNRPLPGSERDRALECARIDAEISRQKAIETDAAARVEEPFNAAKNSQAAGHAVAALDARQRELRCSEVSASAYTQPRPDPKPPNSTPIPGSLISGDPDASFDRCFKRCRQYTDRSKEQCFDVCSK